MVERAAPSRVGVCFPRGETCAGAPVPPSPPANLQTRPSSMKSSLVTVYLWVVFAAATTTRGDEKQDACGVWLQINHNQSFEKDLKDIRFYKGVMMARSWGEIERFEGVFDWTKLDANLERAASLGLYYGIGIPGGPLGPSWLYE